MLIETILEASPDPQCLAQASMSEKSGISIVENRAHTQESQLVKWMPLPFMPSNITSIRVNLILKLSI